MKNYLKLVFSSLVLAMTAMMVVACATSGVVGTSDTASGKSEIVEIQNKSLAKKVSIKDFKTRIVNDLLNVQVEIESNFNSTQEFQYKFSWFDTTGFAVDSEASAWNSIVLHGKESKTVQALAPNPAARKFKIVLRKL